MKNEVEKVNDDMSDQYVAGEHSIQVAHTGSFSPTINVYLSNQEENKSLCESRYFNLLVGYDPSKYDNVTIARDRALTEYIAEEIESRFCPIGEHEDDIKKLPAIIIEERDKARIKEQQGVIARITNIRFQRDHIVVYFKQLGMIPMIALQYNPFLFGLDSEWELNRTHWVIKDVCLANALNKAGVDIPEELYGKE